MINVHIEPDYRIPLPEPLRGLLSVGDEVAMMRDAEGRIVIVPSQEIAARLDATFGLWAGREDVPVDGVAYVDDIRQGTRLDATD